MSRWGTATATVGLLALGASSLFVAKRLHLRDAAYAEGRRVLHRLDRTVHPILVTDTDIWKELGPTLALSSDSLESYRDWRARRAPCRFPRLSREPATEIRKLALAYPEVWNRVRAAALQYAQDSFRPFEGPPLLLGRDFTWTSFPLRRDTIYIYELATLQHLPLLAEAYLGSGDPRFLGAIRRHLASFLGANPIDNSANWTSPMEVSIRLYSLVWLTALLESDDAGSSLFPALVRAAYGHARFIADNLDKRRAPNNVGIFAAAGLYFFSTAYPEFGSSRAWRRLAESRLLVELRRQYTPDGAQREFAPTYQLALADVYAHYAASIGSCGGAFKTKVNGAIRQQLWYLHLLQGPGGRVPLIRDSDDHHFVRLADQSYRDANATVFLGYAATGGTSPVRDATALWTAALVLGDSAVRRAIASQPQPDTGAHGRTPRVTVAAGPGMVRFDFDHWGGLVDFGSLGASRAYAGHSHAAFGNLILWKDERPVTIDPGTYTYRSTMRSPGGVVWRNVLRSSQLHNTAVVDDSSQVNPTDAFGFASWPEMTLLFARLHGDVLTAGGMHDGYVRLGAGRSFRLLIATRDGLAVVDWFPAAQGRHRYSEHLTLADSGAVLRDGAVRLAAGVGYVVPAADDSVLVVSGSTNPPAGWKSSDYGSLEPTPEIETTRWADGSAAAAVVLRWMASPLDARAPRPVIAKPSAGLTTVAFSIGSRSFELLLVSESDPQTHLYRVGARVFDGIGALLTERGVRGAIPLGGTRDAL